MAGVFFGLMIGLELKHYVADYFLQPGWMLAGKGNVFQSGGYVHAGIHAGLSLLVLLVAGTSIGLALMLTAAEFVLHYALDYAKIHYSGGAQADSRPRRFWVLHGIDQIAHQLTYMAMIFIALRAQGLA